MANRQRLGGVVRMATLALVWSFSMSMLPGQEITWTWHGAATDHHLGRGVAGAGDVNGDGIDDFVVSSHAASVVATSAGLVEVYSGADGSVLHTWYGSQAGGFFGWSVAGAGDVDGDGFADVVIGARGEDTPHINGGRAYVYSGGTGALLHVWAGTSGGDEVGYDVAGAGDVDGDGRDDVLVGAPRMGVGGTVLVCSGADGSTLLSVNGDLGGDRLGHSLSPMGDVDGDGTPDFAAGAPKADGVDTWTGFARVYSGATGAVLLDLEGDDFKEQFGTSVAGVGDLDGDAVPDLLVGAIRDIGSGNHGGSARVYSGATGSVFHAFHASHSGDELGFSVASAGDVDRDGTPDVVVGAPKHDTGGAGAGRAIVFSGSTGAVLYIRDGAAAGDRMGYSVGATTDRRVIVGADRAGVTAVDAGTAMVVAFPLSLGISQPDPTAVTVKRAFGWPGHVQFTAFSFDPANAGGGFGTGSWFGLHIATSDVIAQWQTGLEPFRGTLDAQGRDLWSLPPGSLAGLTGVTVYAVTITIDPATWTVSETSNLVAYTFQ